MFFNADAIKDYRGVLRSDADKLRRFNGLLREKGIFKSESKFYISLALTEADIAQTIDAIAYASENL